LILHLFRRVAEILILLIDRRIRFTYIQHSRRRDCTASAVSDIGG
jgi:hypothetical protein